MSTFWGWFSAAEQRVPEYDPGLDCPCPYCGRPLSADDVRTTSLLLFEEPAPYCERSYFYRTHRTRDAAASRAAADAMERGIVDAILGRVQ